MSNAPLPPDKTSKEYRPCKPTKEDRVVSVRLSDELIAGADKIASATERTRVQVIRLALKTFIDAQA